MSGAAARERIDAQFHKSFAHLEASGTARADVDEFINFLRTPGTLQRSSLIVRCRFAEGSVEYNIVVEKDKINQRLSTQFIPFLDRIRHRLKGFADVLVLVSDTMYVVDARIPQCVEFLKRVPLLRADWSESDPVSSHTLAIPDFFIQDTRYGEDIPNIDEAHFLTPFAKRKDVVKWRGRLTGPDYPDVNNCDRFPRYQLLKMAAANPSIVDARITHYDNVPYTEAGDALRSHLDGMLGGRVPPLAPSEFVPYKYLVSIDGVVSAWKRVANTLRTGSVLLLQHRWKQYFYPGLMPWEHYVPIADDISDLPVRLAWLRQNLDRAEEIGRSGRRFAEEFLSVSSIEDHFVSVVNRCAKLPRATR